MIYLSRVQTNTAEIARRRLSDNYAWHKELWLAFPGRPDEQRDYLFRVDKKEHFLTVWILSPIPPEPLPWGHWETKEISEIFLTHRKYQFSLRANPTVMRVVRLEDGSRRKNGRRTTIYKVSELEDWLREKGEQAGFTLESIVCEPPVKEYFYKGQKKGVHSRVDFSGILSVSDREKFVDAYQNGIGSAKAFGFGLLLLIPIE